MNARQSEVLAVALVLIALVFVTKAIKAGVFASIFTKTPIPPAPTLGDISTQVWSGFTAQIPALGGAIASNIHLPTPQVTIQAPGAK